MFVRALGVSTPGPTTVPSFDASAAVQTLPSPPYIFTALAWTTLSTADLPSNDTDPSSGDSGPAGYSIAVNLPAPSVPMGPQRELDRKPREISRNQFPFAIVRFG